MKGYMDIYQQMKYQKNKSVKMKDEEAASSGKNRLFYIDR